MKAKKTKRKSARKGIGGRKFTGNEVICISIHPTIAQAYMDAFDCGLSPAITRGAKYLPVSSGAALAKRSARLNKALASAPQKTHTTFTGLNEKGRAAMTDFLRANLKDQSLLDRQKHFEADIDFDRNPGSYELAGRFTKSGNPATKTFEDDEMKTGNE